MTLLEKVTERYALAWKDLEEIDLVIETCERDAYTVRGQLKRSLRETANHFRALRQERLNLVCPLENAVHVIEQFEVAESTEPALPATKTEPKEGK